MQSKHKIKSYNWSKCRHQLTRRYLTPSNTITIQLYPQDVADIIEGATKVRRLGHLIQKSFLKKKKREREMKAVGMARVKRHCMKFSRIK